MYQETEKFVTPDADADARLTEELAPYADGPVVIDLVIQLKSVK
jgi:hypothetical protein